MTRSSLVDLRRAASAGDDVALEKLATRLGDCLSRYFRLHWQRLSESDYEDYVHESLLLILPALNHCRAVTDAALVAWATSIGKRVAIHDLRIHRHEVPFSAFAPAEQCGYRESDRSRAELLDANLAVPCGDQTEAEELSICRMIAQCAARAQAVLPTATQELLYHRLIGRAPWSEIATWASTTPSAAKRRFQRARRTLGRQILRELERCPPSKRAAAICWLSRVSSAERHKHRSRRPVRSPPT